jgi:hypothetical protein
MENLKDRNFTNSELRKFTKAIKTKTRNYCIALNKKTSPISEAF